MSDDRAAAIQQAFSGMLPDHLGIRLLQATKEGIVGEMRVGRELCTLPGRAHGGALMAFADTLGACGAVLNLPEGAGTATLESKTNFFAAGPEGGTLRGESTPLHVGRRTMVWQTRITAGDALVALVTQTQMVLPPRGG
jgi:uncharacterized protein (TIGR00369 family)